MKIGLVGCGKKKAAFAAAARDLYLGSTYRACLRASLDECDQTWILSAEHGLLHIDRWTHPYEKTLNNMTRRERQEWAWRVTAQMKKLGLCDHSLMYFCGKAYREFLPPGRWWFDDVPLPTLGYQRHKLKVCGYL